MARPTMVDLFAGCGGFTSGFVTEGFNPIAAVENDFAAASTYAANFGEDHTHWLDIADWADADIPSADVVVGGPPCQGFSNLGAKDPDDIRNRLWEQYVRVLLAARPSVFVIENVDRFHSSVEYELLRSEVDDGRLRDYELVSEVLNAADYGVPQKRKRTIVIGSRDGKPRLPEPTRGLEHQRWMSLRDVISDIPAWPDTTSLPDSTTPFFGKQVRGVFKESDLHLGRNPTELSLRRYDCIPPGGGRFDLPDELLSNCWRNKPTGTTDVMGRLEWDQPSVTIRTEFFKPEKGKYLHPQWEQDEPGSRVNRPITHQEAARIQSFPSDFLWCGSKTEIARQIGNAVPPTFARAIAAAVKASLGRHG